jgi:hypothetical protein
MHATIEELCFIWSSSRQFLGNGSVNIPKETNKHATLEVLSETGFSVGPRRDVITEGIEATKFSSVRESVKKGLERVKLKNLHC